MLEHNAADYLSINGYVMWGTVFFIILGVVTLFRNRISQRIKPVLQYAKNLFLILKLGFKSKHAKHLVRQLFIRAFFMLASVYIEVYASYPVNRFVTALTQGKKDAFYANLGTYACVAVIAAPVFALDSYFSSVLTVRLQEALSRELLDGYFSCKTYYHICAEAHIDNPGQRISKDSLVLVSGFLVLCDTVVHQMLRLMGFAFVLFSIAPHVVPGIILYSFSITFIGLRIFGAKLADINEILTKNTSDYTASVVRVRVNAESIAFYDGGDQEGIWVNDWFGFWIDTRFMQAFWMAGFEFFLYFTKYLATGIPYLLLAPALFKKEITFGDLSQSVVAFRALMSALNVAVTKLSKLTSLSAVIRRVNEVRECIEQCENYHKLTKSESSKSLDFENEEDPLKGEFEDEEDLQGISSQWKIKHIKGSELRLNDVSVVLPLPERTVLVKGLDLSVSLDKGSLLVVGNSGVGKSSLLRVIAGLWLDGKGKITSPDHIMFLPQKPYMPYIPSSENTLRKQVLFPWHTGTIEVSDTEIINTLKLVNLTHILDRLKKLGEGIHKVEDWGSALSQGEQQRLSFARLLLAKPTLVFLDEATSALDEQNEIKLYRLLADTGISYVSVGHHPSLTKYHKQVLLLEGNTNYSLLEPNEYLEKLKSNLDKDFVK